ncbi:hypothetical protein K438DRAFT_1967358 [Mycena galopus ATCC 62051]|nr:hypothetical protein K438DRAFT_1967358 [Mycena galopus ATCC 62051]
MCEHQYYIIHRNRGIRRTLLHAVSKTKRRQWKAQCGFGISAIEAADDAQVWWDLEIQQGEARRLAYYAANPVEKTEEREWGSGEWGSGEGGWGESRDASTAPTQIGAGERWASLAWDSGWGHRDSHVVPADAETNVDDHSV